MAAAQVLLAMVGSCKLDYFYRMHRSSSDEEMMHVVSISKLQARCYSLCDCAGHDPKFTFLLEGYEVVFVVPSRGGAVAYDKPRSLQQFVEGQDFWPRGATPVQFE